MATDPTKDYGYITDDEELKASLNGITERNKTFAFDIESGYDGPPENDVSISVFHPRWKLVGFSYTDDTSWARYIPIAHDDGNNANEVLAARLLWQALQTGNGVPHNAMFELQGVSKWFRKVLWDDTFYGAAVRASYGMYPIKSDTMLEAHMTQMFQPLVQGRGVGVGLKGLTKFVFGHQMTELKSFFVGDKKHKAKQLRFNVLPVNEDTVNYGCEDSAWTLALHERHYPIVCDMLMFKAEIMLLPVLCAMEQEGLMLDWDEYNRRREEITRFRDLFNEEIQGDLSERLGEMVNVNFNAPKQVQALLYERLGLPVQYNRKTKKPTADAKALAVLARKDPGLTKIVEWRGVAKLLSAYIVKYLEQLHYDPSGRARPSHNQLGAGTGRFSVDKVSYQQWPKPYHFQIEDGTVLDLNYRNFLIAPEGYRIVGFDFSQVELRVLAGMANETGLLQAFNDGIDIHKATASIMLGIPLDKLTEKDRAKGKTLNFAIVYGSGADAIGEALGISVEEAQALLDQYFDTFSGLKGWMNDRVQEGQNFGFVFTKFGRKFKIWDYVDADEMEEMARKAKTDEDRKKFMQRSRIAKSKGDRMCVNAPVQGGAADYLKLGMIRTQRAIKEAGLEDKIILVMTIHDALEFYVHESVSTQQVIDLINPCVSFPVEGLPEILAEWHEGRRWGEVVEVEVDKQKQITGYSYKMKVDGVELKGKFSTIQEAYAWQDNPPIPEQVQEVEATTVDITMPQLPLEAEWAMFKEFWTTRKGKGMSAVTLHFPEGTKTIDGTASILNTDIDNLQHMLTGSKVKANYGEELSDDDLEALFDPAEEEETEDA